jgi:hypothetical protein
MKKLNTKEIGKLITGKKVNQIVKLLCGELIGKGVYRDVYVLKQNPDYVVKIEREPDYGQFANVTEWRNYINYKEWKFLAEWLAPCELINETGQILIQARINWDGKRRKDYSKEIPSVFTDTKLKNFGWLGDKFVCCDYSFFCIYPGKSSMKKPKWWGTLKT